jgi:hypothetical protein
MVSGFTSKAIPREQAVSNEFILYKIVDSYFKEAVEHYKIQCINTKAIFDMTLRDIVFDVDILYGLHPAQGCYVGIEYGKVIKADTQDSKVQNQPGKIFDKYAACRYGSNNLLYQNRQGLLGFECKQSKKQCAMDPRDIVVTKEVIEAFDAVQAFCIGVLAGLKFSNPKAVSNDSPKIKTAHLRLVDK